MRLPAFKKKIYLTLFSSLPKKFHIQFPLLAHLLDRRNGLIFINQLFFPPLCHESFTCQR